jgi:hypothetical protein
MTPFPLFAFIVTLTVMLAAWAVYAFWKGYRIDAAVLTGAVLVLGWLASICPS